LIYCTLFREAPIIIVEQVEQAAPTAPQQKKPRWLAVDMGNSFLSSLKAQPSQAQATSQQKNEIKVEQPVERVEAPPRAAVPPVGQRKRARKSGQKPAGAGRKKRAANLSPAAANQATDVLKSLRPVMKKGSKWGGVANEKLTKETYMALELSSVGSYQPHANLKNVLKSQVTA
jgi:hypothetical protein